MNIREMLGGPNEAQQIQQSQLLTEEGQTYFNQVLTEYHLQTPSENPTPEESQVRAIVNEIVAKPANERTWGDLFGLEIAVVKLQSEDCLRRGAWAIRAKYKDLVGDKTYDAYQTSNPPDPKTGDANQLRCDTLEILSEFHWAYAFAPLREKIRSELMKQVFVITTVLVVAALAIAGVGYFQWAKNILGVSNPLQIPVLAVVISLGMIGGYTSLQQRIQSVPSTGDPIVNIAELANSQFSLYLAPISGAVFAVLLYIIFIGGLLSGPLFPKISTLASKCTQTTNDRTTSNGDAHAHPAATPGTGVTTGDTGAGNRVQVPHTETQSDNKPCSESVEFSDFLKETGPESGVSFAILLVWSFIAGFAERFVPDTIDRLVNQAAKK
jgi:hypothetical protein